MALMFQQAPVLSHGTVWYIVENPGIYWQVPALLHVPYLRYSHTGSVWLVSDTVRPGTFTVCNLSQLTGEIRELDSQAKLTK